MFAIKFKWSYFFRVTVNIVYRVVCIFVKVTLFQWMQLFTLQYFSVYDMQWFL